MSTDVAASSLEALLSSFHSRCALRNMDNRLHHKTGFRARRTKVIRQWLAAHPDLTVGSEGTMVDTLVNHSRHSSKE